MIINGINIIYRLTGPLSILRRQHPNSVYPETCTIFFSILSMSLPFFGTTIMQITTIYNKKMLSFSTQLATVFDSNQAIPTWVLIKNKSVVVARTNSWPPLNKGALLPVTDKVRSKLLLLSIGRRLPSQRNKYFSI